ncbi:DUF4357 domain-containing protein [Salipaludibacillus aurantiacus]|uniref:Uncharacterized conserved protein, contains ParB-like and HNH nuclease domains n=1 Tax=Salipaludibacillus aurantiacus TaxID=1601833 RepID=A0A1H9UUS2_9BACI|nr:DUF4357 domain-containing protein [Salipaludibacillus aurantiacus]SES12874.1 Uncharacterized conserved protein, contains ParB-like and HNH nuclease domains [Salipaludibacillus aurantiacus]
MKPSLSAEETPLFKIFSDDFLFSMPAVQRPYSWTTEEAGELLDDLLDYIEHYNITEKTVSRASEPYFLGSIVLVKGTSPTAQVLDGQQRLTTLTILLAVLRDYLSEDYADDISKMIVQKGNKMLGTTDTYRLKLRNRENYFFQYYIQKNSGTTKLSSQVAVNTDSEKIIRDNAIYFVERLNEIEVEKVKTLPSVIATLCYIVVVSTPSFDSAFRIFTVLNDRGLDLMISDIFKAKVLGDVIEENQDEYTKKWEDVEVSLGRERFNKLFEHIRMIIQKRKGSANIKDEYENIFLEVSGEKFIDEILIPYSEAYLKLVDYRMYFGDNPRLLKLLSLLNRIDNNDWMPPAIYYLKNFKNDFEKFLIRLEILAGTSMVLRKNFNWRMSRYSQLLREMSSGIDILNSKSSLDVKPGDKYELLDKLNGDVYIDLKDTSRRYILLRLDSLLTTGQPYYDQSVITVEHVLPQNPKEDSEWNELFEEPERYIHKLGNLVLLTRKKNSQAKNYDFNKKKRSYFQTKNGISSFAITTQVIQETEWTPKVLQKRQEKLIAMISKAWELNVQYQISSVENEKDIIFYISGPRNAEAQALNEENGFMVLKGSSFAQGTSDSFSRSNQALRDSLIKNNKLINKDEKLILVENYTFDSPSAAASVVLGRNANGRTEWRNEEGKSFANFTNFEVGNE